MSALTVRLTRDPSHSSFHHILPSAVSPSYSALIHTSQPRASQRRSLWRCPHHRFDSVQEENERLLRRLRRHHRHHVSKLRRTGLYSDHHHVADNTASQGHHPWWHWSWGWTRPTAATSSPPGHERQSNSFRFWNRSADEFERDMEEWRREIERDPYTALFGRRLKPFNLFGGENGETSWSAFCRSFLGMDHVRNDAVAKSKTVKDVPVEETTVKASASEDGTEADSSSKNNTTPKTEAASTLLYEFDPISGRMVPRTDTGSISSSSAVPPANEDGNGSVDIAVKRYTPPEEQGERQTVDDIAATVVDNDSLKEQSDVTRETAGHLDSKHTQRGGKKLDSMVTQLNESVDAATRDAAIPLPEPSTASVRKDVAGFSQPDLVQQERLEDLDLLSASDIRRRYVGRKTLQDTELEKQRVHQILEKEYFLYRDPLDQLRAEDIRSRLGKANHAGGIDEQAAAESGPSLSSLTSPRDPKRSETARPETAEDAANSTTSAASTSQSQGSASSCGIHRAAFRILAYDSTTKQVITAETASSLNVPGETPAPAEILSRLSNPAKFLPYFATLKNDGYEIVSGGGDILIFGKMNVPENNNPDGSLAAGSAANGPSPSKDGSLEAAQTPRDDQRSPVNENAISQSDRNMDSANSSRFVQRQETVYTGGPPNWSPYPPAPAQPCQDGKDTTQSRLGIRGILRRMLLTGTATAATCYAIGVVIEFFRTGGAEGRGVDGFTEFESERRQNERS